MVADAPAPMQKLLQKPEPTRRQRQAVSCYLVKQSKRLLEEEPQRLEAVRKADKTLGRREYTLGELFGKKQEETRSLLQEE